MRIRSAQIAALRGGRWLVRTGRPRSWTARSASRCRPRARRPGCFARVGPGSRKAKGRPPARQEGARRPRGRGRGSGPLRLAVLPDASGALLGAFAQSIPEQLLPRDHRAVSKPVAARHPPRASATHTSGLPRRYVFVHRRPTHAEMASPCAGSSLSDPHTHESTLFEGLANAACIRPTTFVAWRPKLKGASMADRAGYRRRTWSGLGHRGRLAWCWP